MARRLSDKPLSAKTLARARARKGLTPAAPPPPGNKRAVRSGAQISDGRTLESFHDVVGEVRGVLAEAGWIGATDMFSVENFASELTIYRHAAAYFATSTPAGLTKRHKAQRVNVQRLRVLNEMARELGLTPAGRFRLGLTAAKTEAISVKPRRTDERALEVAEILAQARALPPAEGDTLEPTPEPPLEKTPDLHEAQIVPLHAEGSDN